MFEQVSFGKAHAYNVQDADVRQLVAEQIAEHESRISCACMLDKRFRDTQQSVQLVLLRYSNQRYCLLRECNGSVYLLTLVLDRKMWPDEEGKESIFDGFYVSESHTFVVSRCLLCQGVSMEGAPEYITDSVLPWTLVRCMWQSARTDAIDFDGPSVQ